MKALEPLQPPRGIRGDRTTGIDAGSRQTSQPKSTLRRYPLAWFAGAQRQVLARCPSEAKFFGALGLAVILTATFSGLSLALTAAIIMRASARRAILIGAIWALGVGNIDRALVMTLNSHKKLWAAVPRILLSLAAGALFSIPFTLIAFSPEINAQLAANQASAVQQATAKTDSFYNPKIATDQNQISSIQSQENALQTEINQDLYLEDCEVTLESCSQTGQLGYGAHARHDAQQAATDQAELAALKVQDDPQIQTLNTQITQLTGAEKSQVSRSSATTVADSGLIAREQALSQIERGHPDLKLQSWFLALVLIGLDLVPLTLKLAHLRKSPYEAIAASLREEEHLEARRIDGTNRVELARITEQADSDIELNQARIAHYQEERMARYDVPGASGAARSGGRGSSEAHVHALNLDDFVGSIRHHEAESVDVPRTLQLGASVGTALMLATTLILFAIIGHPSLRSEALCLIPLAAATALGVYTRGFRRAPAWALRACFAVFLVGLALPAVALIIR